MKRILLILGFILIYVLPTKASHNLGGELTYRCIGGGLFVFEVVYYRDCTGTPQAPTSITLANNGVPGAPASIFLTPVGGGTDITPVGVPLAGGPACISCGGDPNASSNLNQKGAVGRFVYRSAPVNFTSVPAPPLNNPYLFYTTDMPCCRNDNNNTTSCGQGGMVLRITMSRFINPITGLAMTPAQLCDSAPSFSEPPASANVRNNFPNPGADTVVFNNNALDPNLDSLVYTIDFPWEGLLVPCSYLASGGFSAANPFPGIIPFAPGIPLNPNNGVLEFRPTVEGEFLTCIKVTSYRCGQKISEVYRDFQNIVVPTPANYPTPISPTVTYGGQLRPLVTQPFSGTATPYARKFYVESPNDSIAFDISGTDFDRYPFQLVDLYFTGQQFTTNYRKNGPCASPPCAYLQGVGTNLGQQPGPILNNTALLGYGFRGIDTTGIGTILPTGSASGRFVWKPTCANLPTSCAASAKYVFVATVKDSQCPVPGKTIRSIELELLPKPLLKEPVMRCADVLPNGTVQISWVQDFDSVTVLTNDINVGQSLGRRIASFQKYYIYRKTGAATVYALIDSILSPAIMTYTDAAANANANAYQYKVSNISGCYNAEAKTVQPISPMRLSLNSPTDQIAPLSWTDLNPNPATAPGNFSVERSLDSGITWNTIATTPQRNYRDTVYICNGLVKYRIFMRDASGCVSHSTVQSNIFKDILPPDSVNTVVVTVDTLNDNVVINWLQNANPDVVGYVIYTTQNPTSANPIYTPVDTIFAIGTYTYPDIYHRTDTGIIYYNIAAFDSCTNISAPVTNEIHNNIWLRADVDPCNSTINLTWNAYKSWALGVKEYEVWRSEPGTADVFLAKQAGITYTDATVISQKTYCYTIIAVSNDAPPVRSLSNKLCIKADVVQKSDAYVRYATVLPAGDVINLAFVADTAADVLSYELERSISNNASFEKIATIAPNSFVGIRLGLGGRTFGDYYYTDRDVRTARSNYYYRVKSIDACGGDPDVSNLARSLLLKGSAEGNFTDSLWWNPYPNLGFYAGLGSYDIYRQIPTVGSQYLLIGSSGLKPNYVDNIVTTVDDNGKFCYYVEALEFNTNVFGLLDTARSNVICVTQPPRMFVPNAFVPNGVNNIFLPKGIFIDKTQGYSLKIFNRWGEEVFTTTDFNTGWTGTAGNSSQEALQGVYVYVIKFLGKDGNIYDVKGTLALIR